MLHYRLKLDFQGGPSKIRPRIPLVKFHGLRNGLCLWLVAGKLKGRPLWSHVSPTAHISNREVRSFMREEGIAILPIKTLSRTNRSATVPCPRLHKPPEPDGSCVPHKGGGHIHCPPYGPPSLHGHRANGISLPAGGPAPRKGSAATRSAHFSSRSIRW